MSLATAHVANTARVALVTGAARRVGRAIAVGLAEAGCDVAIHYHRSESDARETARLVEGLGRRAALLCADLCEPGAATGLPGAAAERLGRLDILVNNASTFEQRAFESLDAAAWRRAFEINTIAPALLAQAAAPHLRRGGRGRIINLLDIAAERPWRRHAAYSASKAALANATLGMAKALAPDICVNGVAPGVAEFPDDMDEGTRDRIVERVPARRCGRPEDIAAAVVFLARDASYVTGTILTVDGGLSLAW